MSKPGCWQPVFIDGQPKQDGEHGADKLSERESMPTMSHGGREMESLSIGFPVITSYDFLVHDST